MGLANKNIYYSPPRISPPPFVADSHYHNVFVQAPKSNKPYSEYEQRLQAKFWRLLIMLAILPLLNSCIYNLIAITKNIVTNINLRQEKKKILEDKKNLNNKFKQSLSQSGLIRTIKEEIKAFESNEILIKIGDN
jgi:hypothetical protein